MMNPTEDLHDSPLADCHDSIAVTPEVQKDHCDDEEDEGSPQELTWQEEHENKLRHIISNQRKLLSQILPPVELDETRVDLTGHTESNIAYSARIRKSQGNRQSRLGRRSKSLVSIVLAENEQDETEQICDDAVKDRPKCAKSNNSRIRNKRNTMRNARSKSFVSIAMSEKHMKELQDAYQEVGEDSPKPARGSSARTNGRRNDMKNRRSRSVVALAKPSGDPDRRGFAEEEVTRDDRTLSQALRSLSGDDFNPASCYGFNSSSRSMASLSNLPPHRCSSGSSSGDGPRRRIEKSFSDHSLNSSSERRLAAKESSRKFEKSISDRSIGSTSERRPLTKSRSLRLSSECDLDDNAKTALLLSSRHGVDTNAKKEQGKGQTARTTKPGSTTVTKRLSRGRSSTGQSLSTRSSLSNPNLGDNTSTLKGGSRRSHGSHSPLPQRKKDPLVSQSDHSSCSKRGRRSTSRSKRTRRRATSKPEKNRSSSSADELKASLSLLLQTPKHSNTEGNKLSRSKSEGGPLLEVLDDTSNSRHGGRSQSQLPQRKKDPLVSQSDHSSCSKRGRRSSSRSKRTRSCATSKPEKNRSSSGADELKATLSLLVQTPKRSNTGRDKLSRSKSEGGLLLEAPDDTSNSRHGGWSKLDGKGSPSHNGNVDLKPSSLSSSDHTPRHSNQKEALSRSKSEAGLFVLNLGNRDSRQDEDVRRDTINASSFVNRLDAATKLSDLLPQRRTSNHDDIIRCLQQKLGDKKKSKSSDVALGVAWEERSISQRLSQTNHKGVNLRSTSCLEISTSGFGSSERQTAKQSNKKDALSRSKSEAGLLILDLAKQQGRKEPRTDGTHASSFANRLNVSRRLSEEGSERKTGVHEDIIQRLQLKVGDKKKSKANSVVHRNSTQGGLLKIAAGKTNSALLRLSQSGSMTDHAALNQKVAPCSGINSRKSSDPKSRLKKAIMAIEPNDADLGSGSTNGKSDEDNSPSISQLAGLLSAGGGEMFNRAGSSRGLQVGKEGTKMKKSVYSAGDLQHLVSGVNQHIEKGNSRRHLIMSQTKSKERLSLRNAKKEEAARAG